METGVEKVWPEWKTLRKIGEGSFGKVYEIVRDKHGIEEHSAVKIISIPSSQAELDSMRNDGMTEADLTEYYHSLVDEVVQEISLMSKLKGHTHIVGYEDYTVVDRKDTFGWDIYIRMELLTPLPSYIRRHQTEDGDNAFTERDVIRMAIDMCSALEMCYSRHIVHRDIKPDNIFVSESGDYKLGDFGVARTIDKTVSGLSKKGTYTYMAPEVYRGEACTPNVDLYSLGIVMYKLLNDDREPFLAPPPQVIKFNDKSEALAKRMNGQPLPPMRHGSSSVWSIVSKACAFHPHARYRTPTEMKHDLEAAFKGDVVNTAPIRLEAPAVVIADSVAAPRPCVPPDLFVKTAKSLKVRRIVTAVLMLLGLINGAASALVADHFDWFAWLPTVLWTGCGLTACMIALFLLKKDSGAAVAVMIVGSLCCVSPLGFAAACTWGAYSKKKRQFDVRLRVYARSQSAMQLYAANRNGVSKTPMPPSSPAPAVPAPAPNPPVSQTVYCESCGTAMTAEDVFCPGCGFKRSV